VLARTSSNLLDFMTRLLVSRGPLNRRLGGPLSRIDAVVKNKIFFPPVMKPDALGAQHVANMYTELSRLIQRKKQRRIEGREGKGKKKQENKIREKLKGNKNAVCIYNMLHI
jgi:hypothetical protein